MVFEKRGIWIRGLVPWLKILVSKPDFKRRNFYSIINDKIW